MAEQSDNKKSVMDKITSFLTKDGKCRDDVSKYLAAVHVKRCSQPNSCFTTIACKQEIEAPEMSVEMIEIDSSSTCDLLNDGASWAEFRPDSTFRMDEFARDLYYTPERLDFMYELFLAREKVIVVIDIADDERTQVAFNAYLSTWTPGVFPGNQDNDVAMIPTNWQPTGEPYIGGGNDLNIC